MVTIPMKQYLKRLRLGLSGLLVVCCVGSSSPAFYFAGWPGDGIPRTPSLITPGQSSNQIVPSPLFSDELKTRIPVERTGTETPATPEPTTAALAVLGLGAVAVVRAWRRSR